MCQLYACLRAFNGTARFRRSKRDATGQGRSAPDSRLGASPAASEIFDRRHSVSFSPDGKQLVYTRGYPRRTIVEVRVATVDGTGDHLLATVTGNVVFDSGPTWSPRNDSIAVS